MRKSGFQSARRGLFTSTWQGITVAVAAMALLCAVATDAFGQLVRPSLTTHLLVFALGVLYGGIRRRVKSTRKVKWLRHEKRAGYLAPRSTGTVEQRDFVKLERCDDW